MKENIMKRLKDVGLWGDYYTGTLRYAELRFKSNNWIKLHGLPLRRKKK